MRFIAEKSIVSLHECVHMYRLRESQSSLTSRSPDLCPTECAVLPPLDARLSSEVASPIPPLAPSPTSDILVTHRLPVGPLMDCWFHSCHSPAALMSRLSPSALRRPMPRPEVVSHLFRRLGPRYPVPQPLSSDGPGDHPPARQDGSPSRSVGWIALALCRSCHSPWRSTRIASW